MNVFPLRFREASGGVLFSDESGAWFRSGTDFLKRYAETVLTQDDLSFLEFNGHAYREYGDLSHIAFAWRWAARQAKVKSLSYVMLVPTLRCNLACGYCQVSRAAEGAQGYDWDQTTTNNVISYLDRLACDEIKIEFQGGEPLLRLDLLTQIRNFCRERFGQAQFVVCTNLQSLQSEHWDFLDAPDTFTSTSIDGDQATHTRQRTGNTATTETFFRNVEYAVRRLGAGRISALPTIDPSDPPSFDALIDTFERFGLTSIYFRPINFQGFARRSRQPSGDISGWNRVYFDFIEHLIRRNGASKTAIEEYYFSHCLRRVLSAGFDHHVDLRNPNLLGHDYIVIDYDGTLYPTDEARMLARIGHTDMSIGDVSAGLDYSKLATLNTLSCNNYDPDCMHCPYQPFCGTDPVDDLSRYGRAYLPRQSTWFCQRHLAIFDKIFELIYRGDAVTNRSLARWAGVSEWPSDLAVVHP